METRRTFTIRSHIGIIAPGLALALCFAAMIALRDLRRHTIPFLLLYGAAFLGYGLAVRFSLHLPNQKNTLILILAWAVLFRIALLFTTPPTLSDDVYRYIWDGRLANAGVSPYTLPVNSMLLDPYDSPERALVNNNWMASPYLPAAQALFALIFRLFPANPLAFQLAAVLLDLLTGLIVLDLLRRLELSLARVLIYLWNPLVVVEFAHGAHVDALMLCLMMAALWALIALRSRPLSVIALAAATLTKILPILLLPAMARRWGWRSVLAFVVLVLYVAAVFAGTAGWGLSGLLDGTGLFGALRIYSVRWNFNGGLYHWLEVLFTGYHTPGAAPPEIGGGAIYAAKLVMMGGLSLVLAAVWRQSTRTGDDLTLIRLALIPLSAYLLLTTTVHPWYVTLIVPLLPFLPAQNKKAARSGRFLLPALYFSGIVALSYLTYLDPINLREYDVVRLIEYLPLYLMLVWAAWPTNAAAYESDTSWRLPHS